MSLLMIHVHVHVKPEFIEAFRDASIANARNSVNEPGVVRFDVIQNTSDPARFVLLEIYRSVEDQAQHKETAHYATWRDTVAEMMAEPRNAIKFHNVFPDDGGW